MIIWLLYYRDHTLKLFLQKLQNKLIEDETWKTVIDQFQDGFILFKYEDYSLYYQNDAAEKFFWLTKAKLAGFAKIGHFQTQ